MLSLMYQWDKFALEVTGELLPITFIELDGGGYRVGHEKLDGDPFIVRETGEAVRRISWWFELDRRNISWQ